MTIPYSFFSMAAFGLIAVAAPRAAAASMTWTGTLPGNWDNTTANWNNGTTTVAWDNTANAADTAVFSGTAGTVTVQNTINLGGITLSATDTITGSTLNFGGVQGAINSSALSISANPIIASALTGTNGLTINANGSLASNGNGAAGRLTISGNNTGLTGNIAITGGLVEFTNSSAAGSASTTAGSGGTLQLSNFGGLIATGSNTVTLGNNIDLSSGNGTMRAWGSAKLILNGQITGTGKLNFTDTGNFQLTNTANTYSGDTTINIGRVDFTGNGTAGTGTITVNSGGQAWLDYNSATTTNNFIISGTGFGTLGAIRVNGASNPATALILSGTITLAGDATIGGLNGAVNLTGLVTESGGSHALTVGSAGNATILTLSGTNTYSGGTVVAAGSSLGIQSAAALGSGGVTLNTGATLSNLTAYQNFYYTGHGSNIALSGTQGILLAGNASIDIGYSDSFTVNGVILGAGSLTKKDNGTLTLNGVNTYTGGTVLSTANGTNGKLIVGSTGSIKINGAAGVTITANTSLLLNGTLVATGTTDTISNAGAFTITGGTLNLNHLFDTWNGGLSGNYTLVTGTAATGTLNVATGGYNTSVWSSVTFDGTNLIFTAVPEPRTYGLLGAGALASIAFVRRRRNRV